VRTRYSKPNMVHNNDNNDSNIYHGEDNSRGGYLTISDGGDMGYYILGLGGRTPAYVCNNNPPRAAVHRRGVCVKKVVAGLLKLVQPSPIDRIYRYNK
jgi:hypothetical protein